MVKYLTFAIITIIIIYGLRGAWPLLMGPSLYIDSPIDNASFQDGIVDIQGTATHTDQITLNGALILRKENGDFSLTLSFPHGGSILTFVATDRFGRRSTETRSIFVP